MIKHNPTLCFQYLFKSLELINAPYVGEGIYSSPLCILNPSAMHLLQVPRGTIIRNEEGEELTSLEEERDYYIAARGGSGGKGNHFYVSSTDTTPRTAQLGAAGEERTLFLELRVIADVGLVSLTELLSL